MDGPTRQCQRLHSSLRATLHHFTVDSCNRTCGSAHTRSIRCNRLQRSPSRCTMGTVTATASPATMDYVAAWPASRRRRCRALCAIHPSSPRAPGTAYGRRRRRSDFALSRTASALATGRLGRIGLLVSGPLNTWFNSSVLDAAYATLREAGQELVIYSTKSAADRTHFFATLPAQRNVDALIVASFALRPEEYARLAELLRTGGLPQPAGREQRLRVHRRPGGGRQRGRGT